MRKAVPTVMDPRTVSHTPTIRARASPAQKAVLAETQTMIRFRQALVVRV